MSQTDSDFSILVFELSGKFGHFRKFYTNASSLSYLIPPRTVLTGLLASILEMPRDTYYEALAPETCGVSVAVKKGSLIKKNTHSINMIHEKSQKMLEKGTGNRDGILHSQCKLELLSAPPGNLISYRVYVGMKPDNNLFVELVERIRSGNHGFGVYLGQRQFRANLEFINLSTAHEITFMEESTVLDSLCSRENVLDFKEEDHLHILMEQMPVHMRQEKQGKKNTLPGREPVTVKQVMFERYGKRIKGHFKQCLQVGEKVISFY